MDENHNRSQMMEEVARLNAEKKGLPRKDEDELPLGNQEELEAKAEEETPEEGGTENPASAEPVAPQEEEEEPVRIAGREFKNQKEALDWAEDQERQRLIAEAHSQGIREALEAQTRGQGAAQPAEEEDFEAKFYADPKGTLKEVQQRARDEALAAVRAESQREKMWSDFLNENPDIRRKDAERVLTEHWETIGRMTDLKEGKRLLAQKVRAEYEEILNLKRPKTELPSRKPTVSPSGGAPSGVTQKKKEDGPLSFADQMRKLRKI